LIFTFSFDGAISGVEGVFLLVCFLAYMIYLFRKEHFQEKIEKPITETIFWAFFALIMGFFILIFASELTVTNALILSENFGIRQSFVGILIVGLGTSLPEIATSVSAVKRKASSLAVGNLIGSNILDLLLTPGLGAMIAPLLVSGALLFDLFFLFILSVVIVAFFKTGRVIDRRESIIILIVYFSYVVFKVITI
jgi:cation:H+ antiporter